MKRNIEDTLGWGQQKKKKKNVLLCEFDEERHIEQFDERMLVT